MNKIKNLPLSLIPILAFAVFMISFLFLPQGSDLISSSGDYMLGAIIGWSFTLTLVIDIVKYIKRKNKQNNIKKEEQIENPNIEKTKKLLKNTGDSVYAIGWLTIVANIALYVWSIIGNNYPSNILPKPDLAGVLFISAMMFVFIALGNRVRKLKDIKIKLYLQILLVVSFVFLVFILLTGGRVGVILFIIIAYLIMSLNSINKAMKVEEFTATLTNLEYKLNKDGWKTFIGIVAILFFIIYGFEMTHPKIPQGESIDQIVQEAKAGLVLPKRLDNYTTLADMKAEPNAIRYEYIINDIDSNKLSSEILKNNLSKSVCGDGTLKGILNHGINLEYFYSVEKSSQTYLVFFTKTDCLD